MADGIAAELAVVAPWTAQRAFAAAVASWSYAEAQCVLLRRFLDEHGVLDEQGAPRPAVAALDRAEMRAGRLRDGLGLTPAAWSRLVATLGSTDVEAAAAGLDRLRAIGRELGEGLRAVSE